MSQALPIAEIAEKAILEAVKLGLPVYYKKLSRAAAFLLRRDNGGKGVLFASKYPGGEDEPPGTVYIALSSEPVTVWRVPVAKLEPSRKLKLYPHNVVSAAAQYPVLFSTFEADVWYRRLKALHEGGFETLTPGSGSLPREVASLAARLDATGILYIRDQDDYALARGGLVVAWYNALTGTLVDTRRYLRAAGLLTG